jgi:hypothetical protein
MIRFVLVFAGLLALHACATIPAVAGVLYSLPIEGPTSKDDGSDVIRLHDTSSELCAPMGAEVKRATYTMRHTVRSKPEMAGKVIEGCYVIRDEQVMMIFADGDQGALPLQVFKDGKLAAKGARSA